MNARLLNRLALVIIVLAIGVTGCYTSKPASDHFRVKISSPQQEAEYSCDLIEGILYFKSRGYSPELPDHPLVSSLVQSVSNGSFERSQFATFPSIHTSAIRIRGKGYRNTSPNILPTDRMASFGGEKSISRLT